MLWQLPWHTLEPQWFIKTCMYLLERVIVKSSLNNKIVLTGWCSEPNMKLWELLRLCMYLQVCLSCHVDHRSFKFWNQTWINSKYICCIHNVSTVYIVFPCAGTLHILEIILILTVCRPIQCIQACISHNCVTTYIFIGNIFQTSVL